MKKLLLIALMVSGLAFNGEARVEVPDSCRQTAQDTLASCRDAAQSDYSLALGKCDNLADPAAQAQCQSQASADLNDARQTCQEQNDARLAACARLGGSGTTVNTVVNLVSSSSGSTDQVTGVSYFFQIAGPAGGTDGHFKITTRDFTASDFPDPSSQ